jgi:hypothetical protein
LDRFIEIETCGLHSRNRTHVTGSHLRSSERVSEGDREEREKREREEREREREIYSGSVDLATSRLLQLGNS